MKKSKTKDYRLYLRWCWIKNRCYNPNTKHYPDYGGRGIIMYYDWIKKPNLFVDYCKTLDGWDNENLTLDRINNDGNYEPNNLRFTSRTIQSRNRRRKKDNKTGYAGITKEIMPSGNARYRAHIGINNKKITIGSFSDVINAVIARNNYIIKHKLDGYNITELTLVDLIKQNK